MASESTRFRWFRRNGAGIGAIVATTAVGFGLGVVVGWLAQDHCTPASPVRAGDLFAVSLVRVVDGDTISVAWYGEETSVRLLRIDTPERGQPGYHEATRHLRRMIGTSRVVQLEFETGNPSEKTEDRGRTTENGERKAVLCRLSSVIRSPSSVLRLTPPLSSDSHPRYCPCTPPAQSPLPCCG